MKRKLDLSPNFSKKTRKKKDIKFVIIHYTGMQSEIESIRRLKNSKSKVSCHYLINKKGDVFQMVKEKNVAWHAGKSKWGKFNNLNKFSVGIELVNRGQKFGYENFSNLQIQSLVKICKLLKKKYRIKEENFLGHSDIAPLRKVDPGEKFPWRKLSKLDIGKWYNLKKLNLRINRNKQKKLFFKNIFKIGYRYFSLTKRSKKDKKVITVFQQKYLPQKVSGIIDQKTYEISHFLANYSKFS
tara:strand:- start:116 stop:838 length:723 start_codon:yes stop_codon:yes gene_type:complete